MSNSPLSPDFPIELSQAANDVAHHLDADVILFNNELDEDVASTFHGIIEKIENPSENVFLLLVTNGGDAHAAYTIGRELQLRYKKVILCIAGDCYSAGTLIVCCAHELVITDRGRLGPLDVQIIKKDELYERVSGLTASIAIGELSRSAYETFMSFAISLKSTFGSQLSFKTAMDVASSMTSNMFAEMFKQIDPLRLAEDARALKIAAHYGKILNRTSKILRPGALDRLTKAYPSHQCIIDASEATELFSHYRTPGKEESKLLTLLGDLATDALEESGILKVMAHGLKEGDTNGRQQVRAGVKNGASDGKTVAGKSGNTPVPASGGRTRKKSPGAGTNSETGSVEQDGIS